MSLALSSGGDLASRPNAAARGYDAKWQRTRRRYLRDHPECECAECQALPLPKRPKAEVVHHLDGKVPLGPLGHEPANLQALTKQHHDQLTAREKPSGWHTKPRKRPKNERHPGLI